MFKFDNNQYRLSVLLIILVILGLVSFNVCMFVNYKRENMQNPLFLNPLFINPSKKSTHDPGVQLIQL